MARLIIAVKRGLPAQAMLARCEEQLKRAQTRERHLRERLESTDMSSLMEEQAKQVPTPRRVLAPAYMPVHPSVRPSVFACMLALSDLCEHVGTFQAMAGTHAAA
jgi:hypothetical protein